MSLRSVTSPKSLPPKEKLLNRGMIAILNAQFFSAFADNALFFALLEILQQGLYGKESTYILQGTFALFYILLAPIVGYIADHIAKSQVLMVGNGIKLLGVLLLFLEINPFICYAIVGLGAAVYSPAKFGVLSEFVSEKLLIKANGLIEASTIIAILSGAALGGLLAELNLYYAVALTIVTYIVAAIFNYYMPKIAPKIGPSLKPQLIVRQFMLAFLRLFRDQKARFAIIGTSLFWAGVATLKLLLNDWVRDVLGEGTEMVSQMSVVVGLGVIIGAAFAAMVIKPERTRISLWAGIGMSLTIVLFVLQNNLYLTYITLLLIGAFGGCFMIPLNALLQTRGGLFQSVGSAIAIQNLIENIFMLSAIAIFGLLTSFGFFSVLTLMIIFGGLFLAAIIALFYEAYRHQIFAQEIT